MDSEGSVILESSGEHSILIQTVKDMVNVNTHDELQIEEEEFFVVTDVQDEQQNVIEVSNEQSTVGQSDVQFSWSNLCRICANVNDHLIPIFEGEGLQHDLCNKIHKYLPICVSENDALPLQLCYHCAATLLAWHELLEGCLNAERRLLEMQDALQEKQGIEGLETSTQDATSAPNATESLQQETVKDEVSGNSAVNDSDRCKYRMTEIDVKHKPSNLSNNEHTEHQNNGVGIQVLSETDININKNQGTESQSNLGISSKKYKKPISSKRTLEQRIELAHSKMMVNGFTYYKCDHCKKILSTAYNFLIHLNIHTGEKPYTCHVCEKGFRSASGLNRHVHDVHAGIKKFSCDICGRCLASKTSRDEHRRTHTGERPYICEICGKSFKQRASLHVHKSFHSKVLPHECSLCNQKFKRKQELDNHTFIHTKQKPYSCDVCGKQFRSKGCISRHKRIHNNQGWKTESDPVMQISTVESESTNVEEIEYIQCAQCDIVFVNMKYLINHMNSEHEAQVHYCQYCKLVFHGKDKDFEVHISMHGSNYNKLKDATEDETSECTNEVKKKDKNNEKSLNQDIEKPPCYTCNLCKRNFTKKCELKKHINRHSDINPIQNADETELVNKAKQVINDRVSYKCETCKKVIYTKRGFLRHIRVHSDKRPCKCDLCGKSYRIEQDLARHIRDVHEGLKKYACDICGRAFANKGTKDDHRRIHTGERPYACEHCPKMFRTLNSVYIHNRVHTDYKPHKCSYCGKHFRSRQRLTHHETTHTGIKAFACEICGKTFSVKGEVVRHRAIHNEEKPFDCKCGMKFGQKRYLRNHIKQHHKEASSSLLAELLGNN